MYTSHMHIYIYTYVYVHVYMHTHVHKETEGERESGLAMPKTQHPWILIHSRPSTLGRKILRENQVATYSLQPLVVGVIDTARIL